MAKIFYAISMVTAATDAEEDSQSEIQ